MALFGKENKALIDVIKYNGNPDVLVWKYPSEELGTWTQLIVSESQEAILFKEGKALDIFQGGRHTLDTANIPVLSKIINLPFGGKSPFTAEVWYINKLFTLDIKWGTPTPIQLQDPQYKVFIAVRVNGMFGIKIEDSKKFLTKLVGTMPTFEKENITKYFRGIYITKVKDTIASYLIHKKISILEINAYIDELSNNMREKIEPLMDEYGIKLSNFNVNEISIPESDPTVAQVKNALAKKAEMDIIGYNYTQERSFDTLEGATTNTSAGSASIMGAGMGLGMGVGLGNMMSQSLGTAAAQTNLSPESPKKECPKCHSQIPSAQKFCGICGCDVAKEEEILNKSNSKKIKCSNCGCQLNENNKFCPECGDKYDPCPNCGADIPDEAKFCQECGWSAPKNCPQCNATVSGGAKFCNECGTKVGGN